jgi:hypothetical protein
MDVQFCARCHDIPLRQCLFSPFIVTPAQAGAQRRCVPQYRPTNRPWIPAYAGMTMRAGNAIFCVCGEWVLYHNVLMLMPNGKLM